MSPAKAYWDTVGRPRKLSGGAMTAMMKDFARGATTGDLADAYGVSRTLVLTVCYHTVRDRDRKRIERQTMEVES